MAAEYPFVGREGVLGELRAALEGAAAGRGGLVTLAGPAGVGKTRTAEEAAAHAEGFRTLWTWCPPQTAGRAFRPWSRLLRELVADDVACGRLVAASPPLRALVSGAGPGALRGADPEAARLRLTADVAELLAAAARRRPLLLVLDDAHAADASSLRLLLETADSARTMPLLLLATARDEDAAWQEGAGGPGRDRVRAQLLRRGRVSVLGPLAERDVAALVEAVTGAVPQSRAVRSLVRRTGGDAFFVTELLRNGSWSGGTADGEGAGGFPGAVRAAVRERSADLTPPAARLLDVAAVLGTRFRLDVLAEAADVPLAQVRSLLGEAAGAGLLAEVGAHRAGFRHDLLRDAVYDALAPADRAALHHAAADVLAGHARRGRDTGPAEVAHHLLLAGPEHATDAARYAREAAARAESLSAFEDAARWYERAVDAWSIGSGGDARAAPGLPDRAELVEMLLGLGDARLGAGERDAARGALLRAAGLARELGRPDLLARAALGLGTGPVGFEVDLDDREQVDLLTEARAALDAAGSPPDTPFTALHAAVTARLSLAVGVGESVGWRVALAEEAVRGARAAGDPATLAVALAALCDARPGPEHCRDRLAWSARIVATARDLRDPALELLGRRLRSVALMETGAFAEADAEAAAYEAVVRPLRRPLYAWYVPLWRGTRALMEGRYEDCAAELDEVERLGRRAGSANAALLAVTQRWCLYAETGDRAGLRRVAAEAAVLERSPLLWPRVTLALLAAQSGRPEEAARRLSAVAPRLGGAPRDSEWLPMVAQAAETVAAVGSHPAAPLLYDLLAPYAGLFAVEGIGAAVRGPVDRHLALLAAAMGDQDRARTHRTAALRAAETAGAPALTDRITKETAPPAEAPTEAPPATTASGTAPAAAAASPVTAPAAPAAAPARPAAAAADPTAATGHPAAAPADPTVASADPTAAPAGPTAAPASPAAAPAHPTAAPADPTGASADPTGASAGPTAAPASPAAATGHPAAAPADPTVASADSTAASAGPTAAPASPAAATGHPAAASAHPTGASAGPTAAPASPAAAPAHPTAAPAGPTPAPAHPTPSPAAPLTPAAPTPPAVPGDDVPLFRREGPLWHVRYVGREAWVPGSKGLRDLAVLLSRPGTPVPAVELAAPAPVGPRGAGDVIGLHAQGDTGEAVDAVARAAYRRRLRELEEDARDADAAGDAGRSERIAVERDALVGQLAAAYGIGGRVRRTGSPAERARTAVTARIRAAVERVAAVHPELGRHLRTAVRTGTLCVYQPEQPPAWRL